LSVVACRNYVRNDFVEAAALLESGRVDATPLHTATFALDDFGVAVDQLESHGQGHIKILLTPRRRAGCPAVLKGGSASDGCALCRSASKPMAPTGACGTNSLPSCSAIDLRDVNMLSGPLSPHDSKPIW